MSLWLALTSHYDPHVPYKHKRISDEMSLTLTSNHSVGRMLSFSSFHTRLREKGVRESQFLWGDNGTYTVVLYFICTLCLQLRINFDSMATLSLQVNIVGPVEKPPKTQTSIRLASHLVRAPNCRSGARELESPMWRELSALTKSGKILGVRSFYSGDPDVITWSCQSV